MCAKKINPAHVPSHSKPCPLCNTITIDVLQKATSMPVGVSESDPQPAQSVRVYRQGPGLEMKGG